MFKVGDKVKIHPDYIGKKCAFGGSYSVELGRKYFDDAYFIVTETYNQKVVIDIHPDFGIGDGYSFWTAAKEELMLYGEVLQPMFQPSDIEKIISINLGILNTCFLSPQAAKAIKLKDADRQIFKIYDIDFDTQKVLLRNDRWVNWSDIRLTSDQEHEEGDYFLFPKNYEKFNWTRQPDEQNKIFQIINVTEEHIYVEFIDNNTVKQIYKNLIINQKYFGNVKPKEALTEKFFRDRYPQVFTDLAKKVFDVVFDSYETKTKFFINTNKGKKVVIWKDGNCIIGDV